MVGVESAQTLRQAMSGTPTIPWCASPEDVNTRIKRGYMSIGIGLDVGFQSTVCRDIRGKIQGKGKDSTSP